MATYEFRFDIGAKVRVKELGRPGVVDSLMVDGMGLQYRVTYWDNGERKSAWVYAEELE